MKRWLMVLKPDMFKSGIFNFTAILIFTVLFSCIDEYSPTIERYENLLVIEGSIIKENKIQKVVISRSSPVNNPSFNPMESCLVSVIDNLGNEFSFSEKSPGNYETSIPEEYLTYGRSFQLNVTTPENKQYRSEFESILQSAPIDSIYFEEDSYQNSFEQYEKGFQFYTDLKAPESATKYYRWKLVESYEYHSLYKIEAIWDNKTNKANKLETPDSSLQSCWKENEIKEYYTDDTENLNQNSKKRVSLNYVPLESRKLDQKYCLLIKQYSISEPAYRYWNQKKIESMESGGFDQIQPSRSTGNIFNVNDIGEVVLGYFWASSYTRKRIFIEAHADWVVPFKGCEARVLDSAITEQLISENSQRYLVSIDNSILSRQLAPDASPEEIIEYDKWFIDLKTKYSWSVADPACFDCSLLGGTTKKPDYWQ